MTPDGAVSAVGQWQTYLVLVNAKITRSVTRSHLGWGQYLKTLGKLRRIKLTQELRPKTRNIGLGGILYICLQLALSDAPDLSLWVIRFLVYRSSLSNRLLALLDEQRLILFHGLDSLALDAVDQLFVGRDIVDKANDLTGGPYLMFVSICIRHQGKEPTPKSGSPFKNT
jgi:hypothetical protein